MDVRGKLIALAGIIISAFIIYLIVKYRNYNLSNPVLFENINQTKDIMTTNKNEKYKATVSLKNAEKSLVMADITANKNMVPFDNQSPFITSGIRFGTPAITTRGIDEEVIPIIVDLIDKVILNYENEKLINDVKIEVNRLMYKYPIFQN